VHYRIEMRSESATNSILVELRKALRQQGWTARRLAGEYGIGEATAKRWLAGKGLTLQRLEALSGLAGLSLGELARAAEHPASGLTQELTLAQERALSTDLFLAFLFMTILGGNTPAEVANDFAVPAKVMDTALARLERLALIDRLPGERVRPLVDRNIVWRKAPMRGLFEAHMKQQFMAMDFAAEDAVYASEVIKLSVRGAAELAEAIEAFRRDVHALAERDREVSLLQRQWYGLLSAMRVLDTSALENAS
jgi:transcriptional regulator with XRE-family HTH domain